MITLVDLHNTFDNIKKLPIFEIEVKDGYDIVDIIKSDNGLSACSEYGNFEALFDEFNHGDLNDTLDMMLSELYIQVISKHNELGITI